MDKSANTKLQQELLFKMVSQFKAHDLKAGSSLKESLLAQTFEVSRTPVRTVLQHLCERGICKAVPYKGFVLLVDAVAIEAIDDLSSQQSRADELYLRLLIDLFFGDMAASFSEKELQQRYDANRGEIQQVLRLLENDAIVRRSPGYKWQLDGVLNTLERHTESYRCRLIFEPAGLLEPSWKLDREAFECCRDKHQQAIANPQSVNASQLFNLSANFHELLAACSGNRFLLGIMQQHNRLRKATDLVSMHLQSSVSKACQRRLDIIDLVLAGNNQAAAKKLLQLLENDIRVMTRTYNDVMKVTPFQRQQLIDSIANKSHSFQ